MRTARRQPRLHRTLTIVAAIACALTAASCSGHPASSAAAGDGDMNAGQPALGTIPVLDSPRGLTLPIEAYLLTKNDVDQITHAQYLVVHRCMAEYGFDFKESLTTTPAADRDVDAANVLQRYGVWDPQIAAAYGYHDPAQFAPHPVDPEVPPTDAERLVLFGNTPGEGFEHAAQVYGGRPVPDHGCVGQGQREIGTGIDERLAESINKAAFHQSMLDPRVQAAGSTWSKCMAAEGYQIAEPKDAPGFPVAQNPTSREIEVAKADIGCKRQSNYIGTWYAVDAAMQTSLIGSHEEALAAMKQEARRTLRNAAATLAKG
ncbi:MAG: hypothetical protein HOV87_20965 [Catenulispora sp.]|nr:hypothetical protein [Catenulispora sp.]